MRIKVSGTRLNVNGAYDMSGGSPPHPHPDPIQKPGKGPKPKKKKK